MPPMHDSYEAIVLVRIDNMSSQMTVATMSLRLPIESLGEMAIDEAVQIALADAIIADPKKWART